MNKNTSMIKYKENIITKIRNFFKRMFGKNEENYNVAENNNVEANIIKNDTAEKKFFEDLKVDPSETNKVIDKRKFLEEIDGNVDALKLLSIDRLRKLEKYYDGIIEENEKTIQKLKQSV